MIDKMDMVRRERVPVRKIYVAEKGINLREDSNEPERDSLNGCKDLTVTPRLALEHRHVGRIDERHVIDRDRVQTTIRHAAAEMPVMKTNG
jgi:hypothetical protein